MSETSASENRIPAPARSNPWNPLVSLGRHGRWTVPTAILLAVIAASVTLRFVTPRYRAGFLLEMSVDWLLPPGQTQPTLDLNKERALLFSVQVLDPVLADAALQTAPSLSDPNAAEANLRNNLSMDFAGTSHRLIVCYQDTDPEATAAVCNAVVDSYLRNRRVEEIKTSRNPARRLELEIEHWESEVEKRRDLVSRLFKAGPGYGQHERAIATGDSEEALRKQLNSQALDLTFKLALLNAQLDQNERLAEPESCEVVLLPDAEHDRSTKQRERVALKVELEEVYHKISDEQERLQRFGGYRANLSFAMDELKMANEVLAKLRARGATLQAESRQDGILRALANATPPRFPSNWPLKRMAVFSGIAFVSSLMLGFLLGFRRNVVTQQTTE